MPAVYPFEVTIVVKATVTSAETPADAIMKVCGAVVDRESDSVRRAGVRDVNIVETIAKRTC